MNQAVRIRDAMKKLNKLFESVVSKELSQYGLTLPQILVLRKIWHAPMTIGQISKAVDLSYSTVSGIIDRLEKAECAVRRRDETDRRVIWISKTQKIEDRLKEVRVFQEGYYSDLLNGLSAEQMNAIEQALTMLITQLEKKVEENA